MANVIHAVTLTLPSGKKLVPVSDVESDVSWRNAHDAARSVIFEAMDSTVRETEPQKILDSKAVNLFRLAARGLFPRDLLYSSIGGRIQLEGAAWIQVQSMMEAFSMEHPSEFAGLAQTITTAALMVAMLESAGLGERGTDLVELV
jgi:hypothetical protein